MAWHRKEVRVIHPITHQQTNAMRLVKILSTVAAVGTFLVIVFGKIVRVTGASESIPDWPLAFGKLVPEMTPLVFWEWSHRLLVLLVFITVVALIPCAARVSAKLGMYCAGSLLLMVATAIIGGLDVLYDLNWMFAALDQALAMLFFASLVGLTVWSRMVDA
jgi:cytochrome c oxidase assembly protein subunit 15